MYVEVSDVSTLAQSIMLQHLSTTIFPL